MLDELDAAALRQWGEAGLAALGRARQEIDELNVFPVPDGDTGTNLFLTFEAGVAAAAGELVADLPTLTAAFSRGALLGARGNSGVILAQLLRGMAESFTKVSGPVGGAEFGAALSRAADLGYAAVARPVEGTVLTVIRAAATAAVQQPAGVRPASLLDAVERAALAAQTALAQTPDQLEALRRAGVVDAGGRGLVVLLDALLAVVSGEPVVDTPWQRPQTSAERPVHGGDPDGPAYEVMYLLEAADDAIPHLRSALDALGDSVVVVGGEDLWNVHVHADDPGSAVEAAVAIGRPFRIRITALVGLDEDLTTPSQRMVIAIVPGRGLADLFESVGATVVEGGPGQRPTPARLIEAIDNCPSREVVLLPNDADHVAVAEEAAVQTRGHAKRVAVIPTRAPVQGLAALAVHDHEKRFDDDVVAMASAASATRHGAVSIAVRQAMTTAGLCRAGDVLGLIDDDVALLGKELSVVACQVVDRMLAGGGELVTLVRGATENGAQPDDVAAVVRQHLRHVRPDVEVVAYDGDQALYPLLLGVE